MPDFVKPTFEDLSIHQEFMEDKKTMAVLGGVRAFPREDWASFYQDWIEQEQKDAFFRLMYCTGCEDFVGEAGWKRMSEDTALLYLLVKGNKRNMGYGNRILADLVTEAKACGFSKVCFRMDVSNPSISFFKKRGFEEMEDQGDNVCLQCDVDALHCNPSMDCDDD